MSGPTVRGARTEDASVIALLNSRLAKETEDHHLEPKVVLSGVERALADPALARYFVAEEDGRVVGQVMVTYEWSDWRDGLFWWIQSVYVLPEARERGVFSMLHDRVRAAAKEAGAIGLRLYVYHSNARAQDVYVGRGMKDAGYKVLEEIFA